MAGSSEPAFYLGAKKGAIAQSPIYFLVILRQPPFLYNRKDRLRRSLELRNARLEAGMANR